MLTRISMLVGRWVGALLLVKWFGRELELAHRDGVHSIEGDSDHLLADQVDEVVLAHQQRPAATHKNTTTWVSITVCAWCGWAVWVCVHVCVPAKISSQQHSLHTDTLSVPCVCVCCWHSHCSLLMWWSVWRRKQKAFLMYRSAPTTNSTFVFWILVNNMHFLKLSFNLEITHDKYVKLINTPKNIDNYIIIKKTTEQRRKCRGQKKWSDQSKLIYGDRGSFILVAYLSVISTSLSFSLFQWSTLQRKKNRS